MKLYPVCKVEMLQVTVNEIEVLSSFLVDFCQCLAKSAENSYSVPWFFADDHKD